jgi:hypothetical protein
VVLCEIDHLRSEILDYVAVRRLESWQQLFLSLSKLSPPRIRKDYENKKCCTRTIEQFARDDLSREQRKPLERNRPEISVGGGGGVGLVTKFIEQLQLATLKQK